MIRTEEKGELEGHPRIEKWDLVRTLLIFCVVLGHLIQPYTDCSVKVRALFLFIYSFHMPCFLFVDGLFSKKTVDEKRYTRIFSYLILYLFMEILIAVTKGIVFHKMTFSLFTEDGIPWYALVLFWCTLMTVFLKRFSRKWVLLAAVILACLVGYDSSIGDTLALSRTIVYFPFFFAGYCLDPNKLAERFSKASVKLFGWIVLVLYGGSVIRKRIASTLSGRS